MDEVIQITKDIIAGNIKPIYFFMGDEPYYIDKLTEFIEHNVLQEHERDFNQSILYGRDVTMEDVIGSAKRFPMMADRQVVIVREAQELGLDTITSYVNELDGYRKQLAKPYLKNEEFDENMLTEAYERIAAGP